MRRRDVLAGVATTFGVTGCVSLGSSGGDDQIVSRELAVLADGDSGRTVDDGPHVSFRPDERAVRVTGRFEAGNPCRVPALTRASYDESADRLTVAVGTDPTGDLLKRLLGCPDSLQVADYRATIGLRDGLPDSVHASERSYPVGPVRSTTVWRAQSG